MLSEQLTKQQREDGDALKKLTGDPVVWAALQRIEAKLKADILAKFAQDEGAKRAWLKGSLESASAFLPAIEQAVADAGAADVEEEQERKILRGEADGGSADLAIG